MTTITDLIKAVDAATPGPLTVMRYDHGGGRVYKEEPRTLVADLFQEGDREFYATFNPDMVRKLLEVAQAAEAVLSSVSMEGRSAEDYADMKALNGALFQLSPKARP